MSMIRLRASLGSPSASLWSSQFSRWRALLGSLSKARRVSSFRRYSSAIKQGLVLDKVVLLGRTLDEYRRYFALDLPSLRGKAILDVAAGVSSFCVEGRAAGLNVTAFDAIYQLSAGEIQRRCEQDLDHVTD